MNAITWRLARGRSLTLDRPQLMAILNVTPDSFSDGGRFAGKSAAVDQAKRFIDEGAAIIDVGGESTRPGAAHVTADEQLRRVVPVIDKLARDAPDALISVDTTLAPVARAALDAGAVIINDVSAGRDDPELILIAAQRQAGLILMHRLRPPESDSFSDQYGAAPPNYPGGVVPAVRDFLRERAAAAIGAGVGHDAIVIDPGLGFGKSVDQNLELIRHTPDFAALGFPVLSALSRKSFIGRVIGVEAPQERLNGVLAASVMSYLAGARLFRVHDVEAHRHAFAIAARLIPD